MRAFANFAGHTKHTGRPACCRLCKDVEAARLEADDNCKFLKSLRKMFEKLNVMDDFQVCGQREVWWRAGRIAEITRCSGTIRC
jgi:hypothetical protein